MLKQEPKKRNQERGTRKEKRAFLFSIFYFLISVSLLLPLRLWAADHYVTQAGAGDHDGTEGDAWSVVEFNALTGAGYAGDTFFFSGTFTSQVTPQISGTSGNDVTLDGYEGSDTYDVVASSGAHASTAVIDMPSRANSLSNNCMRLLDNNYLIVQDFNMQDSWGGIYASGPASGVASTHLTIRRNYIHDMANQGMQLTGHYTSYLGYNYITVGGALGQGNLVYDTVEDSITGYTDSHCFGLEGANDVVISYNEFDNSFQDLADASNTVALHTGDRILFEYNTVGNPSGQSCVAIKEHGGTDKIFRFNKCYNCGQQAGFGVATNQADQENYYFYGNYIYDSAGGIWLYRNYDNIYIFSNVIRDTSPEAGTGSGGRSIDISSEPGTVQGDVYVFNNTIVRGDPDGVVGDTGGLRITGGSSQLVTVKNNIFYNNSWNDNDRQVHILSTAALSSLEHNNYYSGGDIPTVYYEGADRTIATLVASYGLENDVPAGFVGDPGLTNPTANNFTIAASNSAVADAGADLSGSVNITIQGEIYNVDFSTRLHPSTDWTTTPPTVIGVSDDSYGSWNIGAYEWVSIGNQAPNGTITSPIPNSPTIDKTETLLFSGSYIDPEDDTCTYAWTWEADSMAIWADATGYDAEPTTTAEVSLVLHGGVYYKCIQDHTSETGVIEPPNVTYWTANANTLASPGRAIFNTEVGSPFAYSLTVTDDAPLADPSPASGSITVNDPGGGSPPTVATWGYNTADDYEEGDAGWFSIAWPTSNASTQEYFRLGEDSGDLWTERAALSFDLDHVDISGETVNDAVLSLNLETNPPNASTNVEIWSCSDAFVEAQMTWNIYSTGNSWTGTHGMTTLLAETAFTTSSTEDQFYDFSGPALTSYVATQALAGNPARFIIVCDVEGAGQMIFTSEDGADGDRPYLTISYGASDPASVPEITNITTSTEDGSYIDGDSVGPFLVTFSEPVDVTGTPQLTLELGATDAVVNYTSGTGTATLTFAAFTVASVSSHTSADLDGTQLDLNGGTILSTDDATAVTDVEPDDILDVFLTGATIGSLAFNKAIVIDTTAPAVTAVNNTDPDATGDSTISAVDTLVVFAIDVNSPCIVYAAPGFPRIEMTVNLTETVYANYVGQGDDTDILLMGFYTTAGMRSLDLNFTGDIDLGPGGKITDLAGNDIDISMAALSLAAVADIEIAVPGIFTIGTTGDFPLWSDGSTGFHDVVYDIDKDKFNILNAITDDVAISAEGVRIRGTGGNVAITGSIELMGTITGTIIKCLTISGGITDNGNDYVYQENCRGQLVD